MSHFFIITAIISGLGVFAREANGADMFRVISESAVVYTEPDRASPRAGVVKKNSKLRVVDESDNGFFKIFSKSGRNLWILIDDVAPDLPTSAEAKPEEESSARKPSKRSRWSYDLGLASGSSRGQSFSEINFGLNNQLTEWLIWRNAFFYRYITGGSSFLGLDSSARFQVRGEWGANSPYLAFAGPGWRIPSEGKAPPFVEAGLTVALADITIGVGIKSLFYSVVDDHLGNESLFFVVLSGGGDL